VLFRRYIPGPLLRDFVQEFWIYENYGGEHQRERILPSATFELVINVRDDEIRIYDPVSTSEYRRFAGALISGPYAGSFVSDMAEEVSFVGVHFRPGGAFPFLGLPAQELADNHVDLECLWGQLASELRERVCAAGSAADRFQLLENCLLARMCDQPAAHRAVDAAIRLLGTSEQIRVRDVAERVGLSQRRLIKLFAAQVGLTPKLFSRVRRFQRALALVHETGSAEWVQIALGSGYFDQAHMINDFVEFCGFTPAEYSRRQEQFRRVGVHVKPNHLPLTE
jgi:AraC-like DNA-binding protein